jgi:hypothetical protein
LSGTPWAAPIHVLDSSSSDSGLKFDPVPDGAARTNQSCTLPNCSNTVISGGCYHKSLAQKIAQLKIPVCQTLEDHCEAFSSFEQSEYCRHVSSLDKEVSLALRLNGQGALRTKWATPATLALDRLQSVLPTPANGGVGPADWVSGGSFYRREPIGLSCVLSGWAYVMYIFDFSPVTWLHLTCAM